jgi:hypothetical protein
MQKQTKTHGFYKNSYQKEIDFSEKTPYIVQTKKSANKMLALSQAHLY